MIMENDVFEIPEKYIKMSASEREAEKERILKEIKSRPSTIKTKKTGQKKIVFNFG